MSDVAALKGMLDYDNFVKFSPILFKIKNLDKNQKLVLNAIYKYYQKYDQKKISPSNLRTFFYYQNPVVDDPEMCELIFKGLSDADLDNEEMLVDILKSTVERHLLTQADTVIQEMINGTRSTAQEEVKKYLQEIEEITSTVVDAEYDVCNLSLTELLTRISENGLNWALGFLNDHFGPLTKATLGHIFARPDAGKTSLAVQHACYFGAQLYRQQSDRCVLYLNNEESIEKVKTRAFCIVNKMTEDALRSHLIEAEQLYNSYGLDRYVKFIGSVKHTDQIHKYIKVFNPRVVFIDQGPKVITYGKESGTERLQKVYNIFRELAKEYNNSIITLGQADNNAEGKRDLYLNNMDQSKTAIPGELDWCLAIGKKNNPGFENVRYFNICKNKLLGRYGRDSIAFDPTTSRYEDR